jgi:hypothetical protein
MAQTKIEWSLRYPRAVLRAILAELTLPEPKRTPSLMACLAEKILTVAADGQEDPINLRRRAIERVRESCSGCGACDGLQAARNSGRWSAS